MHIFKRLISLGLICFIVTGCTSYERPMSFSPESMLKSPHQVKLLETGEDAFLTRIHLIRQAKKEILIQTFIWTNDECGRLLFYELLQAAKRGVKVRIIADQMFSDQNLDVIAFAATVHPNIEIKLYNPNSERLSLSVLANATKLLLNFKKVNSRMHNKVMVIDDWAITGGRNNENTYFDRAKSLNFKDRDILVHGPVLSQIRKSFETYWTFPMVINCKELIDIAEFIKDEKIPDYSTLKAMQLKELYDEIDLQLKNSIVVKRLLKNLRTVDKIAFISDDPWKNKSTRYNGSSRVNETLVTYLTKTKKSILIQSPYLVMNKRSINLFKTLKRNNLEIKISTNSLAATDSWPTYAAFYKQKKLLLNDLNCQIYEFKPVPEQIKKLMPGFKKMSLLNGSSPRLCLHGKTMVLDRSISFIGSYNFDPRSANLNTEVMLVIWNESFADEVARSIEQDCKPGNSWALAPRETVLGVENVDQLLGFLSSIVESVTTVDLWTYQNTSCFSLKNGGKACSIDDKAFYDNYEDMGSFPELRITDEKLILLRLFKSLGMGLKHIL